jgi:hypothetical protein
MPFHRRFDEGPLWKFGSKGSDLRARRKCVQFGWKGKSYEGSSGEGLEDCCPYPNATKLQRSGTEIQVFKLAGYKSLDFPIHLPDRHGIWYLPLLVNIVIIVGEVSASPTSRIELAARTTAPLFLV